MEERFWCGAGVTQQRHCEQQDQDTLHGAFWMALTGRLRLLKPASFGARVVHRPIATCWLRQASNYATLQRVVSQRPPYTWILYFLLPRIDGNMRIIFYIAPMLYKYEPISNFFPFLDLGLVKTIVFHGTGSTKGLRG